MILVLTAIAVPVSLAVGAGIATVAWRIKYGSWPLS